jgi:hypothetical protein
MFNFNRVSRGFVRVFAGENNHFTFSGIKKELRVQIKIFILEYIKQKDMFGQESVLLFDVLTFPHKVEIYFGGKAFKVYSI